MADIYPEHEKLAKVKPLSQAVGGFIEWLGNQGYQICHRTTYGAGVNIYGDPIKQWLPITCSINTWLEKYFEIDGEKLEQEKMQILALIRGDCGEVPTCE